MRPGVSGPVAPDVLENVQSWVLCFLKLIWLLWVARRHCSSVAAVQPGTASQWHIPEQIPAWDSRAVSYISEFRTVSAWTHVLELRAPLQGCIRFLLHCCLVFSQDWLLSSRVAVCTRKHASPQQFLGAFHLRCMQLCQYPTEQCGASGEKGYLCAAFLIGRWAHVRVWISKLSQPKGGVFDFRGYVVLAVLQKGTFWNSRVWGKSIWSLISCTASSIIAETTSQWWSASKFSLHLLSLVFQSYIYRAITGQKFHTNRFLQGSYRVN